MICKVTAQLWALRSVDTWLEMYFVIGNIKVKINTCLWWFIEWVSMHEVIPAGSFVLILTSVSRVLWHTFSLHEACVPDENFPQLIHFGHCKYFFKWYKFKGLISSWNDLKGDFFKTCSLVFKENVSVSILSASAVHSKCLLQLNVNVTLKQTIF